MPPTRETTTTASMNSSTSLTRLRSWLTWASTTVSSGGSDHGQRKPPKPATPGQAAVAVRQATAGADLPVRDDVHVDVAGRADHGRADAWPGEEGRPPRPPAGTEHELGRVLCAREREQGVGHVLADDLAVGAAQALHEVALPGQCRRAGVRKPVRAGDVDGQQVTAGRARGDAGGASDKCLALGTAGEGDDHTFARLPGARDALLFSVALKSFVDLVGGPQQGELAQGGEVAEPEVVAECGVDLLGGVHVAVRQPSAKRLGSHVDQLDLVGAADDRVGDPLLLGDTGDLLDHVVERLEVLDVDGRDDVDARVEQVLDVLPAFLVLEPGTLVCASSSTSATRGARRSTASRSISSNAPPR